MAAVERLREALEQGGKERGWRKAKYHPDGSLDHYMRQLIEVVAGDILEACGKSIVQDNQIVQDLRKGSSAKGVDPDTRVVIYADDLFFLLDSTVPAKPVTTP
jgi:hypothetical protein